MDDQLLASFATVESACAGNADANEALGRIRIAVESAAAALERAYSTPNPLARMKYYEMHKKYPLPGLSTVQWDLARNV